MNIQSPLNPSWQTESAFGQGGTLKVAQFAYMNRVLQSETSMYNLTSERSGPKLISVLQTEPSYPSHSGYLEGMSQGPSPTPYLWQLRILNNSTIF